MRSKVLPLLAVTILTLTNQGLADKNAGTVKSVASVSANMPLVFEPNVGQAAQPARFVSHESGYDAFVTDQGVVIVSRARGNESRPSIELRFVGATSPHEMSGRDPLAAHTNYFVGPKNAWHIGVPQYRAVAAKGIYPAIDVTYYGTQRQLEYDFVVAPGGDPSRIQISLNGTTEKPVLDRKGNVVFGGAEHGLVLQRPVAYQNIGSGKRTVNVSYVLKDDKILLAIGQYDRKQSLVIDPILSYATYLGGSGFDGAAGIAVDSTGNSYVTGQTCSADLTEPTRSYGGSCDAYVMALNADGTSKYTTYIGGTKGEQGKAIAASKTTGSVVVVGFTQSPDFPIVGSAFQSTYGGLDTDGFVAQLDSSGLLTYSSFVGSSDNDVANGVVIDSAQDIVIVGQTRSADFPGALGGYVPDYDAFILKLTHSGEGAPYQYPTAAFARYFDTLDRPLTENSFTCDTANAVSLDSHDDIFIAGTGIPQCQVPSNKAEFVAKFQGSNGSFVYGWINQVKPSEGLAVAVDSVGQAVVAGTSNGGALLQKVNAVGSDLILSSVIADTSAANAVALDANGAIYVGGTTTLSTYPLVSPTQPVLNGTSDAFVTKFDQSGSMKLFSTYYGGSGSDNGTAIAIGPDSSCPTSLPACAIYLAGTTYSADLPVTSGAPQKTADNLLAGDAFLAKWLGTNLPYASLTPLQLNYGDQTINETSTKKDVTLTNRGDAALQILGIEISTGPFAETHTCGMNLAPAASCTISVVFAPTDTGYKTGTLTIRDNSGSGTQTIALTGNGVTTSTGGDGTPDFRVALSPSTATVSAGGSATFTLTSTPVAGFTGMVTFTCTAPNTITCALSPTSANLDSTSAKSVTVTVTTLASSATGGSTVGWKREGPFSRPTLLAGLASAPFGVVGFVMIGVGRKSRKRRAMIVSGLLLLVAMIVTMTGCSQSNRYGTPAGDYSVTITATSGTTSHAVTATMTVH